MAKEKYELAKVDYDNGMKYKDIAEKYGVTINTVKSWKTRKWNNDDVQPQTKSVHTKKKGVHTKKDAYTEADEMVDVMGGVDVSEAVEDIFGVDMMGLNERQFLFCLEYLKCFNATRAYKKIYECDYASAAVNGSKLLKNAKIKSIISYLRKARVASLMLTKEDILQKYMDIAFADISDYMAFGREEEILYNDEGEPEIDMNGNVRTYMRSYVHLNNSDGLDGTLVTEVKQGRDGITVKLADKMKALQVLAQYTELLNPHDLERLRAEQIRMNTDKTEAELQRIRKLNNEDDKDTNITVNFVKKE